MNRYATAVVHTVPNHGPAIVLTRLYPVELITALGAMLVSPDVSSIWMDCQTLWIAMAVTPDLRTRLSLVDKRVIFGHTPVIMQSYRRSVVV